MLGNSSRGMLLAAALVFAPPAQAQPEDARPTATQAPPRKAQAAAQAAMRRGLALSKRGDHAAALVEFRKAADLVPEANLPHRYAGDALVELHRYEEAIASYETYLRVRSDVHDAAQVRQRVDELRARYLEGTVDVECTPEGAEVSIDDGTIAGATPVRGLKVRAGAHRLTVRADGYSETSLAANVVAGTALKLQCTLERLEPVSVVATPPEGTTAPAPPKDQPPPRRSHVVSTLLFGAGVAALGLGVGAAIWAKSTADQEQASVDPSEKPRLRDAAHGRALLADIAFGTAAALVVTGVALRFTVERTPNVAAARVQASWTF